MLLTKNTNLDEMCNKWHISSILHNAGFDKDYIYVEKVFFSLQSVKCLDGIKVISLVFMFPLFSGHISEYVIYVGKYWHSLIYVLPLIATSVSLTLIYSIMTSSHPGSWSCVSTKPLVG